MCTGITELVLNPVELYVEQRHNTFRMNIIVMEFFRREKSRLRVGFVLTSTGTKFVAHHIFGRLTHKSIEMECESK